MRVTIKQINQQLSILQVSYYETGLPVLLGKAGPTNKAGFPDVSVLGFIYHK